MLFFLIAVMEMKFGRNYIMKLPLALYTIPFTLCFYAFGFLFRKDLMAFSYKNIVISIISTVFFSVWYFLPYVADVRTSYYHPSLHVFFVCIILSVVMIEIVKHHENAIVKIKGYKYVSMIGRNTLIIYVLHSELLRVLPLKHIPVDNMYVSSLIQFVVSIMVISIILVFSKIVNKYMYWSVGRF